MSRLILVTGATGYVGGRLVPRLLERGYRIRCLVRDPARLQGTSWARSVEVVKGDVLDAETLPPAMEGVDVAYYLLHAMQAGDDFESRDLQAAGNFGTAAREAGVARILYLGGLEPSEGEASDHLQSRLETGDELRRVGPPVTEFRAAVIVGSGSASFELVRHLTERVPLMVTPRWVRTRTQPIAIRDVLTYLLDALDIPETEGRVIEIGGPEVLTYGDMFLRYARVRGLRRVLLPVPLLTPRLSSLWAGLVTPVSSSIAKPLIRGLKNEVVVTDPSGMALFDVEPISYDEAVSLALDRFQSGSVETIWHGALSSSQRTLAEPIPEQDEGLVIDKREALANASPESVFTVALSIGGETGWLYANRIWKLRGALDALAGGPGLRRGRRNSSTIREGEALDFWRVERIVQNRLLRLRAEMKVPGRAWLEFRIEPVSSDPESPRTRIVQTAYFEPKGLLGLSYWYALAPIHPAIFRGMVRRLAHQAEGRELAARTLPEEPVKAVEA